ncbi:MAG: CMP/dCMP kinase [Acidimicrobiaceae bacterium]|nr:CMP/dCMP kinase [Acidimicrobiaceae bacterium]MDQ1444139.1 CMP/dCMP kinase [Acidimicrobiaceae bacterium]
MRVIAIDGPAGSGKSTVARRLAERLGLDYLDSGAMYRSVALAALQQGVDPHDADAVAALAPGVVVEFGDAVRTPEVNAIVSAVAAVPAVRTELVRRQREWADEHGGGVVEGRDIGTVVFPHAELKVFLTASAHERARRRGDETGEQDYDVVAADLARRDDLDSTRETSPLKPAEDALVIDTTGRPVDDIVDEVVRKL